MKHHGVLWIFLAFISAGFLNGAYAQDNAEVSRRNEERTSQNRNRAGLFVEPGLTGEMGRSKINYPAPFSDSSGSVNGYGLSARLGIHFADIVFAGVDGRYSRPQFTDSTNNYAAPSDQYNIGPVAGIQTPFAGIRLWAAYIPWGEVSPGASNGLQARFSNPTGYRVGAGLRLSVVSVNLEYQDLKYNQTTLEKMGPFTTNTASNSVQLENSSLILGLSFPMAL